MPELPEVEVSRRGLLPFLPGQRIIDAILRAPKLRHEIPSQLSSRLTGLRIDAIQRRGKYLLFDCESRHSGGWLLLHLGMSGSLRLVAPGTAPQKHDHVDLVFTATTLRFRDPRRFGTLLWHEGQAIENHPLIAALGIEPLTDAFSGDWLYEQTRRRSTPIKPLLMDSHLVVGIGNTAMPQDVIDDEQAASSQQAQRTRHVFDVFELVAVDEDDVVGAVAQLRHDLDR